MNERITAETAHEHIGFWVRVINSSDQGVTLHFPAEDCSRSAPRPRCQHKARTGEWTTENVHAYPPAHASDHLCELCLADANDEPDPRSMCEQRSQADVLADLGLAESDAGRIVPDGGDRR